MEYWDNILCITGHELILSDSNPNGIMVMNTYKSLVRRGHINVVRRGGGEGSPALIELKRMPEKYRRVAEQRFSLPEKAAKLTGIMRELEPDVEAIAFFKSYVVRYDDSKNDKGLPEETQAEYANNAAILNACATAWMKHQLARRKQGKKPQKEVFWTNAAEAIGELPEMWTNSLPTVWRRLFDTFEKYNAAGYNALVSWKWANTNTQKITAEAGDWLVAQFASMIDRVTIEQLHARYNLVADDFGWKKLKSSETVRTFLYREEIQPRWYAARYGELQYKEKYIRQHRTILPTRRDTLWYSDGTKLNYYYQDEKGNVKTCQVYEVIDAYSEVFLGFHISNTEDYEAQYYAFRMAIGKAGHKPYEVKFDNQGGHKKLGASDLFRNLAKLAVTTQPYNGKSKTIESAFGRFQQEFLHKDWYFTGQNIQAKKQESKVNMEFVLANAAKLPTLEQIKEQYRMRRDEWNNAPHPKTKIARLKMYNTSVNDATRAVDALDMVEIFGVMNKKPSTYRSSGIEIEVKGTKYAFEVLGRDGMPDMDFNRRNIGRKFHVKFTPDDMTMVALYEEDATGLRFVTIAQEYIKVHRALQDQVEGDRSFIAKMDQLNKAERVMQVVNLSENLEKHGLHPNQHGLNTPNIKGVSGAKRKLKDVGEIMKEVSNHDAMDEVTDAETVRDAACHVSTRPTVQRGLSDDQKAQRKAVKAEEKAKAAEDMSWEEEQREYLRRKKNLERLELN